MSFKRAEQQRVLDAISSLKRATGIPDHPSKPDHFDGGICKVFTADAESAEVIAELAHKVYYGRHTPAYYATRQGPPWLKDMIEVEQVDIGEEHTGRECFKVSIPVMEGGERLVQQRIKKIIEQQIAPGNAR